LAGVFGYFEFKQYRSQLKSTTGPEPSAQANDLKTQKIIRQEITSVIRDIRAK